MKLLDILLENTLEYKVEFVTIKDKDVSQGSASYKELADAERFFDSITDDPEVYRAELKKVMGADSGRNVGGASFVGGTETIEYYNHPATKGVSQGGKHSSELTPAELDIRKFANSRLGTMGKEGFTSKDGSYKYLEEGFGDQIGAAASGIGKGISSVLSTLIGAVVAIGVLIITGAAGAIGGIVTLLGFAGVGIIRAVEQFVIIPSINSALKRLSEDEEVMAIAKKPSASGLRKIADEKLTAGERLFVGDWVKKNVTRSMLGVSKGRKTKRGPGLRKDDYMGLTERVDDGMMQDIINDPNKRVKDLVDWFNQSEPMFEKDFDAFMYGRYEKFLNNKDAETKTKMYKVLQKMASK
jgi:hypothetical protein